MDQFFVTPCLKFNPFILINGNTHFLLKYFVKIRELRLASDYTMNRREVIKIYNQTNVILPHVIEPSFGIGRLMYAILEHNFKTRPSTDNTKIERSVRYLHWIFFNNFHFCLNNFMLFASIYPCPTWLHHINVVFYH